MESAGFCSKVLPGEGGVELAFLSSGTRLAQWSTERPGRPGLLFYILRGPEDGRGGGGRGRGRGIGKSLGKSVEGIQDLSP